MEDIVFQRKIAIKNKVLRDLMKDHGIKTLVELEKQSGVKYPSLVSINRLTVSSLANPSLNKLAQYFKVTPEYLVSQTMMMAGKKFYGMQNLEEKAADSVKLVGLIEAENVAAPYLLESDLEHKLGKEKLLRYMDEELSEREKMIVNLRFGLKDDCPRTLEEVARVYDLTRERIRGIEAKALKKLRKKIIESKGAEL